MRKLIIISAVILSLAGCYEFKTPPLSDKDLRPISETAFGKVILKVFAEHKEVIGEVLSEYSDAHMLSDDYQVLPINDDFIVLQSKEESGNWKLELIMRNSTHLIFCKLLENNKIKVPQSLQETKKNEMMGETGIIDGPSEELKKFALKLVETSPKVCAAIPYSFIKEISGEQMALKPTLVELDEPIVKESAPITTIGAGVTNAQAVASATAYVHDEVRKRWKRPPDARNGMFVEVRVRLEPTGEVISVEVVSRDATDALVTSVRHAVLKVGRFDKLRSLDREIFDANFREFKIRFRPEDLRL